MEQSFAYFLKQPLATEKEVEDYMSNLGVNYYDQVVEITIDPKNLDLDKLNKDHKLYNEILEAQEKGLTHFSFYL